MLVDKPIILDKMREPYRLTQAEKKSRGSNFYIAKNENMTRAVMFSKTLMGKKCIGAIPRR